MTDGLQSLLTGWELSLRARNLASSTVTTYLESGRQLVDYLAREGVSEVSEVERRHVEGFISEILETRKPATAHMRYRSIQQWFAWLIDEDEIDRDPMERMKPPTVPETPVPLLSTDQLRALLKACEGKDYADRRDAAIVRLFVDTGMRLSELTHLTVDDVDLSDRVAVVLGKGRRPRGVPFGIKAAQAIERHMRGRARIAPPDETGLWLSATTKKPLGIFGVGQMLKRRGEQAGIEEIGRASCRERGKRGVGGVR